MEADAEVKEKDGLLTIAVTDVKPQDTVTICLPEDTEIAKNDVMTRAMDLLLHAEISYITKEQIDKSSAQSRRKGSNSGCRAAEHGTFK